MAGTSAVSMSALGTNDCQWLQCKWIICILSILPLQHVYEHPLQDAGTLGTTQLSTEDTHQGRAQSPGGILPPTLRFPPLGPASWL